MKISTKNFPVILMAICFSINLKAQPSKYMVKIDGTTSFNLQVQNISFSGSNNDTKEQIVQLNFHPYIGLFLTRHLQL